MRKVLSTYSFLFPITKFQDFCSYPEATQTVKPKKLPIEITSFEELVNPKNNYAFVDKTLLIKSLTTKKKNYLILRPQGWGKSLNLSMLKCFFSINNENQKLLIGIFSNLRIGKEE